MMKFILLIATFLLLLVSCLSMDQSNLCKLKIAKNEKDLFQSENFIYDSGNVSQSWRTDSSKMFVSDFFNKIDFFYLMEVMETPHEDIIDFNINSDKPDYVKAIVNIRDSNNGSITDKITNNFLFKSFEVSYKCLKQNEQVNTTISLTVKSNYCKEFTIFWIKNCNSLINNDHNLSDLNIGVLNKKSYLLIKDSIETDIYHNLEIPIKQQTLDLNLFLSKNTIELDVPKLIYDENTLEAVTQSDLMHGGLIDQNPRELSVVFLCKPNIKGITDVELILKQKSNEKYLSYVFRKNCDTITQLETYFTFLYIIYWIMMFFVILFAISTGIYFMNRNGITVGGISSVMKRELGKKFNIVKEYLQNNNYSSIEIEETNAIGEHYTKTITPKQPNNYGVI